MSKQDSNPQLITTSEVSEICNVPKKTIEHWVLTNHKNIPFIRLGDRTVRFCKSSILSWLKEIEAQSDVSTSSTSNQAQPWR